MGGACSLFFLARSASPAEYLMKARAIRPRMPAITRRIPVQIMMPYGAGRSSRMYTSVEPVKSIERTPAMMITSYSPASSITKVAKCWQLFPLMSRSLPLRT